MANDRFARFAPSPTQPATSLFEIEPDDETDLTEATIALNVATAGLVRVTTVDGSVGDVFVVGGTVFPLRVRRVWATGTTATGIRGLC
jgi:hypothetical protein